MDRLSSRQVRIYNSPTADPSPVSYPVQSTSNSSDISMTILIISIPIAAFLVIAMMYILLGRFMHSMKKANAENSGPDLEPYKRQRTSSHISVDEYRFETLSSIGSRKRASDLEMERHFYPESHQRRRERPASMQQPLSPTNQSFVASPSSPTDFVLPMQPEVPYNNYTHVNTNRYSMPTYFYNSMPYMTNPQFTATVPYDQAATMPYSQLQSPIISATPPLNNGPVSILKKSHVRPVSFYESYGVAENVSSDDHILDASGRRRHSWYNYNTDDLASPISPSETVQMHQPQEYLYRDIHNDDGQHELQVEEEQDALYRPEKEFWSSPEQYSYNGATYKSTPTDFEHEPEGSDLNISIGDSMDSVSPVSVTPEEFHHDDESLLDEIENIPPDVNSNNGYSDVDFKEREDLFSKRSPVATKPKRTTSLNPKSR